MIQPVVVEPRRVVVVLGQATALERFKRAVRYLGRHSFQLLVLGVAVVLLFAALNAIVRTKLSIGAWLGVYAFSLAVYLVLATLGVGSKRGHLVFTEATVAWRPENGVEEDKTWAWVSRALVTKEGIEITFGTGMRKSVLFLWNSRVPETVRTRLTTMFQMHGKLAGLHPADVRQLF